MRMEHVDRGTEEETATSTWVEIQRMSRSSWGDVEEGCLRPCVNMQRHQNVRSRPGEFDQWWRSGDGNHQTLGPWVAGACTEPPTPCMEFRLQSFRRKKRGQCYLVAVWRRLLGRERGWWVMLVWWKSPNGWWYAPECRWWQNKWTGGADLRDSSALETISVGDQLKCGTFGKRQALEGWLGRKLPLLTEIENRGGALWKEKELVSFGKVMLAVSAVYPRYRSCLFCLQLNCYLASAVMYAAWLVFCG